MDQRLFSLARWPGLELGMPRARYTGPMKSDIGEPVVRGVGGDGDHDRA